MSMSLAEVRFMFERARGLIQRGLTSLRTRGWQASWERVKRQFARHTPLPAEALYLPANVPFAAFAVPASSTPSASIIIPVYNQVEHTLACLRALAAHPPAANIEILVVDDGSSDQTGQWLPQLQGLHYHRRASNGGFIAACNDGAARARGDYLVFLNNDTVPQPGWLDALLGTFSDYPEAGLVGAQLVYPDGRLQEAGGIVFADGSAWNYGRFESPEHPLFGSVRAADYCSGAAIAVPRVLFEELGGFDTRYTPAYYEDTDLAFAVRQAGRQVLYQPQSRVVHMEGVTSGTDPGSGTKAYQLRNRAVFEQKWRAVLQQHAAAGGVPGAAMAHRRQREILIIDEVTPRPDHDSGSLRLVNLMRLLIQEGAHVVFLPTSLQYAGRYTQALRAIGVEVWHEPWCQRPARWLASHGPRFSSVLMSRHYVASEFMPLVRRYAPQAQRVFDSVDLHYLRESRAAELINDKALRRSAAATRRKELAVIAAAHATLVVSPTEKQLLARDAADSRVEVVSNLHQPATSAFPFAQRRDLLFVGGFRHPPNADAVRWFVSEILPRARQLLPALQFHCIGSDPGADILALAGQPGVHIHGYVEDLQPYLDGCRLALAPLRYGAGVKGKINLSMAHGQPVVATTCAVEGMHLVDGHDVLVADDAQAFADAIVRLYGDEDLWQALSRNGIENVRQHFSLDSARAAVRAVFFAD
ncbi:glycosyltransferase [Pseudoxanthomonas dokdonensis]|uniref:Glycosyl transferase n=1 Tax=Pseudoxanthomonas dokdonensis TaxID=344882 RepID=A0A0R0CNJ2_9GAMM|nr:glycosyltransferase [Pseudoxanthomonas dokdonensis]KRG71471.1 glycosyl transferase [Pseudoxanthomonas dokdonensis]